MNLKERRTPLVGNRTCGVHQRAGRRPVSGPVTSVFSLVARVLAGHRGVRPTDPHVPCRVDSGVPLMRAASVSVAPAVSYGGRIGRDPARLAALPSMSRIAMHE